MGLLSWLFGGGAPSAPADAPAVEHGGFEIVPAPIAEGGEYRISALIRQGEREHRLIRADTMRDRDTCIKASIAKARQMIDERGARLFD
jgi:hypothetical protein